MVKCIKCKISDTKKNRSDKKYQCKDKICNHTFSEMDLKVSLNNERIDAIINRNLMDAMNSDRFLLNTEPTRFFSVGEKVDCVAPRWSNVVVVEVKDDRYYKISHDSGVTWKSWRELFKLQDKTNTPMLNKRKESIYNRMQFSNIQIEGLLSKVYHFGVDMNPDYQRELVWDESDKVLLVDSIMNKRDIGKFVFIVNKYEEDKPMFEILDGKQRLSSIIEFYEDRFKYKGLLFSEMKKIDQYEFLNHLLSCAESEELSQQNRYKYFVELNVSGKPQDTAHIEKVKSLIKN